MRIGKSQKAIVKIIILLIFLNLICGCLTYPAHYVVKVNGYTGGKPGIQSNKTVIVFRNPKAQNPLLEEEIASKITIALKSKDFIPSDASNGSEYILFFSYGIGPGSTYTSTFSYEGTRLNIFTGRLEPTTEVGSSVSTVYTRRLFLNLYELKGLSENSKPVWVGESYSTGSSSDLRKVVDYLILGAFEHFGEDTGAAKTHKYSDR